MNDEEEGANKWWENLLITLFFLFAAAGICFCLRWIIDWKFQHDIDAGRDHAMMQMLNLCLTPESKLQWLPNNSYKMVPNTPVTFDEFRNCMTETIE